MFCNDQAATFDYLKGVEHAAHLEGLQAAHLNFPIPLILLRVESARVMVPNVGDDLPQPVAQGRQPLLADGGAQAPG